MKRLFLVVALLLHALPGSAEPFRIATYNVALSRKGPAVLLRDILQGDDNQIDAITRVIKTVRPDVLLLNELDHDHENRALRALIDVLAEDDGDLGGIYYPYFFAPAQNSGAPSGYDLNGDGRFGGPEDAFGFGRFRGQYAMALVSRYPIIESDIRDFMDFLEINLPNADLPTHSDGSPFPSLEVQSIQRLSSKSHWDVPVSLPDGRTVHILASHPTPPVFDGPEDQNGKRNGNEIRFWLAYLNGLISGYPARPPDHKFVVLGDLNADPLDGEGHHQAINQLLSSSRLQDPKPKSRGAVVASATQGIANKAHNGNPALDTADWRDDPQPGNLRVDYVLPSQSLKVLDAGVYWPAPDEAGYELIGSDGRASSDHRLVWVDLE